MLTILYGGSYISHNACKFVLIFSEYSHKREKCKDRKGENMAWVSEIDYCF